jgi:hypothetical protein
MPKRMAKGAPRRQSRWLQMPRMPKVFEDLALGGWGSSPTGAVGEA